MKAVCPVDPRHDRFETTAHVVQSWAVDRDGNFLEHLEDLETAHGPDPGNLWTCLDCQSQAVVYEDDEGRLALEQALKEREIEELSETQVAPSVRARPSELAGS